MTILFAGGGTGGHLYPAIAIAEEMTKKDPANRAVFVGTAGKIEARVVPAKGYEFHTIWISGFSRRLRLSNILFPLKVIVSLVQSFFVIRKVRPQIVLGTGGYVCGPVLFVASVMGIPTVVHESNSYPGVTTRMLASRADRVFVTFAATKRWLSPKATVDVVGNPTRNELSEITRERGAEYFGLSPAKRTVFVFGGSLGAASLNAAMPAVVKDAIAEDYQVIWQTGESAQEEASPVRHTNIIVRTYIERMDCGYAAADLVVCRSGATTLAELTRVGKPAILVPFPFAAADHQTLNAASMVEAGAAVMLNDRDLKTALLPRIKDLLEDGRRRKEMENNSRAIGKPEAGKEIVEKLYALVA